MGKWHFDSVFIVEIIKNKNNNLVYFDHDYPVPQEIVEEGILLIPYTADGFYDRGRFYGKPEDCYQPEGENEISPNGLVKLNSVDLPKELSDIVFEQFVGHISDVSMVMEEIYEDF